MDTEEDEDITPDVALDNARRAYLAFRDKEPAARDFAAEALLDVYNQEWNQGEPIDEDAFMEHLAWKTSVSTRTAASNCSTTPPICF